ncbi:MAG: hypothetical protein JSU07_08535 [Bacteroidetes bacterium]|nr:hypothetical protein [Bacteroidota bacterium]
MRIVIILLFTIALLASCKNDLNLNAPYKDIPNVYAVLCPQNNVNVIRINKTFLTTTNAYSIAKNQDTVNYAPGELSITLNRFVNGTQVNAGVGQTVTFKDSVVQTSQGAYSTTQRVYVTYEKLSTNGVYILTIKNNVTQKVFTAQTNAIDSIQPTSVQPWAAPYYPAPQMAYDPNDPSYPFLNYYSSTNPARPYGLAIYRNESSSVKADLYQVTMRYYFWDSLTGNTKISRSADFNIGNFYAKDLPLYQNYFSARFTNQQIANALGTACQAQNLNNTNVLGRWIYKGQIIVNTCTQNYIDYLAYSAPSFNINQQKPIYSNFDNQDALGIFSVVSRFSIYKSVDYAFASSFSSQYPTCQFKFVSYSVGNGFQPSYCP